MLSSYTYEFYSLNSGKNLFIIIQKCRKTAFTISRCQHIIMLFWLYSKKVNNKEITYQNYSFVYLGIWGKNWIKWWPSLTLNSDHICWLNFFLTCGWFYSEYSCKHEWVAKNPNFDHVMMGPLECPITSRTSHNYNLLLLQCCHNFEQPLNEWSLSEN